MADASYAIGNFLGGEISQFAQGRFDKPDYRTSLKTCLNAFPVEAGAWTRRPGTLYAGTTRGGAPGRVIKFDIKQQAPYTIEFTDSIIRVRSGTTLLKLGTLASITSISVANPAVVQVSPAPGWADGSRVVVQNVGTGLPLLQNREVIVNGVDGTHFKMFDAITGAGIDGSTLGAVPAGAGLIQVLEIATSYGSGSWANVRAVQAEKTSILLCPTVAPQALSVTADPTAFSNAAFGISPVVLNDGPYLDPFTNGVLATPSAKSGIVSLTISFPAWNGSIAYPLGSFVTYSGINYVSKADQNSSNQPDISPGAWGTTAAGAAINNGLGFVGTDVGRLVRLFSEPPAWSAASTYAASTAAAPVVVSYNPSGQPGATLYWESQVGSNLGFAPGADNTHWKLVPQGAAIWTWGKVTGLSNIIDRALAGSLAIGSMGSGGGNAAAFNGGFSQVSAASAEAVVVGGLAPNQFIVRTSCYVGKNYSGASAQRIQQVTVYPSVDNGIIFGTYTDPTGGVTYAFQPTITLNLRASNVAPGSPSDGTLLGTSGLVGNFSSAVTIQSADHATTFNYVWVEVVGQATTQHGTGAYSLSVAIAQLSIFSPFGTGTGTGVTVEILGPPLLYTGAIASWRLGVFSDTTGWPTCGVYNDGRLYLGGAVANRFDACVANGINGSAINFAPTDQYGAVSAASAISYTVNSDGVNKILWMDPDLQGIKMGTQAGEWLVQAPTAGPISPTNITARNVTRHGSANVVPCRTEHTTVFVQRFAKKLMEYFPDVFSGKFSAPNLADKAQHIARAGVAELAYTSAVNPIIWGRDLLGGLFGITYKRDSLASSQPPSFYGWHRHALGSGRVVESICAGPSVGGDLDALTMVTNDPVTNVRHVEIMTDTQDELGTLSAAWFLDDAVTPSSTVSSLTGLTINGLWHLNGKTVQVFAGGLDCGDPGEGKPFSDFLVANGSITVPYGDEISVGPGRGLFTANFVAANPQIVVGFTYNSDGQLTRPIAQADSGARNGPAFGKLSRAHRYAFKLVNTLGLSVGGTFAKMRPANFKQNNNSAIPSLTTFTGISQDTLEDDYDYDRGLCWRVSRPLPATVVVAGVNLQTQDQ